MRTPTDTRATGATDTGDPDWGDLERRVERAQIGLLFERTRISNLLGVPIGLLLCSLLWNVVAHTTLLAWLALKLLVCAARVVIAWRHARSGLAGEPRWGRLYEGAVAIDGVVYGLIGTWLLPLQSPEAAALMIATVIGIAAVGLIVLSSRFVACMAFCVPVLAPPIVYQLTLGTRLSFYAATAMAIFLGLIVSEGRRAARATRTMLRLRFETAILAAQRQQALDLAERHSAAKGQFLATMSHEMRTPLHGMLSLAALAREGAPQAERYLGMLESTGRHLLGLINDVLDYSKIESGHLTLAPAPFDLAELVSGVAELTHVSAAEKGLSFTSTYTLARPCWVRGDAARLRQVLLNLTGNAVKFTAQGHIELCVRGDGAAAGPIVFDLIDSGEGVPPDERERIFEPFRQGDGSFGRKHGGTGLGLAISRELARAMGGELTCHDHPTGAGARFVLRVPLPPSEPASPAPPPAVGERLRGEVLLVEDNPVNALVAEAILTRAGLVVHTVDDGAQAVARLAERRYDLVLMDCQMPGMDGFEATRRIRAREQHSGQAPQRIVALTANALEGDRQRSLEAGMDDHLAKPFGETELAELLQRHLGDR
ncbi:response regulator [Variovorax sp. YR752]|uniref:response regulator n=1 Tax=Variovorax sp. YR752 TaxID=1884383 RepID=UPI003137E955